MKLSKVLIGLVIFALAGISFYSLSPGSTDEEYLAAIKFEREDKDAFLKSSKESPFARIDSSSNRTMESFSGLKYFDADLQYRIKATLVTIENKKVVELLTSSGEQNKYLEYAYAEFRLAGISNRILLLEVMAMGPTHGTLFVAFADETSAKDTYGAGRYLEIKKVRGASSLILDFNKAYNPYCAYVDSYSCPFPPKENILKVAIRAGEKVYH